MTISQPEMKQQTARGGGKDGEACEMLQTITVIGDADIAFTVTGLRSHEMPVVGTYVDPRLAAGFRYRVRRLGRSADGWLFEGRALRLLSVGAGYAKRLTFEPDCLNEPQNFFWSDSAHDDGFACEVRAVFPSQRFRVTSAGSPVLETIVMRADSPQVEEHSERLPDRSLQKFVRVHVTCRVGSSDVHVSGTAVLRRRVGAAKAELVRVENAIIDASLPELATPIELHPL